MLLVAGAIPYILFFYGPFNFFDTPVIIYAGISLVFALILVGKLIAVMVIFIMTGDIKSILQLKTYIFGIYFPLLIIYCGVVFCYYAASASV